MSKATWGYIVFALLAIAALWAELQIGSRFAHAQPDLAGKWSIDPAESGGPKSMSIEQSGKYVELVLDQSPARTFIIDRSHLDGDKTIIDFEGSQLSAEGVDQSADYVFRLDATRFHAHRSERTYMPVADNEGGAKKPAASTEPTSNIHP